MASLDLPRAAPHRRALVQAVLRLRFRPLPRFYDALYRNAIRAVVRAVRRVPGVRAIYLTGSAAADRLLPGLSDLDFKIIADGCEDDDRRRAILNAFARLRRRYPMLGPPDEKGVYFLDDLDDRIVRYPLIRHLFDPRFFPHRLLWGDPVLDERLVAPADPEIARAVALWRMRDWTERLAYLAPQGVLPGPQRRYLGFKAVTDLARLEPTLGRDPAAPVPARSAALDGLRDGLAPPMRSTIDDLLRGRRDLFLSAHADPERVAGIVRTICARLLAAIDGGPPAPFAGSFETVDPLPDDAIRLVRDCLGNGVEIDSPACSGCLPSHPLDCIDSARPVALVRPAQSPSWDALARLRIAWRARHESSALLYVRDPDTGFTHAVHSESLERWIVSTAFDPFAGRRASAPAESATGDPGLARLRDRLDGFVAELPPLLEPSVVARFEPRFLRSFARTTAIVLAVRRGLHRATPVHPADVDGVRRVLTGPIGLSREWADCLLDAGPVMVSPGPLTDALAAILEASAEGTAVGVPALPPRPSVSVVVITRNRAAALRRCLESLARLTRAPDELVVVDNGSTDDTAGAVHAFAAPFPVRLVREDRVGVAVARNRGLASASGEVIAFTDDDAVVDPDWLGRIEEAFAVDPAAGAVGGRIEPWVRGRSDCAARYHVLSAGLHRR